MNYLLKGNQYTKMIASSSCKQATLGTGDTFFTVDQMQKWVQKYHKQVNKLASHLKAETLQQSVSNIHRFLHSHIAYEADGALQVIKSPSCTWKTRAEGTDCKTFSVFASCLLTEMGYNHFIRQVKQPYMHPDKYTHVYVVVSVDQNSKTPATYYVLDGTVANNKEVQFSNVKDVFMAGLAHIGLAGSLSKRSYRRGLGNPVATMAGLEGYLSLLSGSGVSHNTISAIRSKVQAYVNQGVDPVFRITAEGTIVGTELFPYTPTNTGRSATGLRDPFIYINNSLGVVQGRSQQPASNNGSEAQTIAMVAQEITQTGFFQSTFGEVFANGFDLSCWNSATSVSKVTKNIEVDFPHILKQSGIEGAVNATTLRNLFYQLEVYRMGMQVLDQSKFAKCTREGGRHGNALTTAFIEYIQGAVNATLQAQNKRLAMLANQIRQGPHDLNIASNHSGGRIRLGETLQVKSFRIETVQGQVDTSSNPGIGVITIPSNIPSTPNIPTTTSTNTGTIPGTGLFTNTKGDSVSNTQNNASMSAGNILGVLAAVGVVGMLYSQSKKQK